MVYNGYLVTRFRSFKDAISSADKPCVWVETGVAPGENRGVGEATAGVLFVPGEQPPNTHNKATMHIIQAILFILSFL